MASFILLAGTSNYIRNNATNSHVLGLGDVFHSTIYNNTLISGSHPFYLLGCDNLISHNYINAGTVPGVNGIPYVFYITRILGHSMATWYRNPQNGTISNNIIEYNTIDGSGSGWLATVVVKRNLPEPGIEFGGGGFYTYSDNNYTMESPYHKGLIIQRNHDRSMK